MANLNFNKVIIGGRITDNLEIKQTPSGKLVLNFTVAVNTGKGDSKIATYFNCTAWDKTAENIARYFRKGSTILAIGTYTPNVSSNEGEKKITYPKFTVFEYCFVDSKNEMPEEESTGTAEPNPYTAEATQFEEISDEDLPF